MTEPMAQQPVTQPADVRIPISDALVMLGGVLILGFSFAPFVSYEPATRNSTGVDYLAWEWTGFLAPLTWFVVVGGLLLLALGLSRALNGDRSLVTFRTSQLQLVVAAYAASVLIGYALTEKGSETTTSAEFLGARIQVGATTAGEFGWGGVLMLIGALIAVIGAVMNLLARSQR
ncbi:FtsH-binding integral membrane protein [Hamadaea flava]|uniref:Uncharacterized protein n=1 Tax=Hamadaea flava TaxID=1742688 RepID=A0ABV8LF40_9ACTN|nr:hypothetical protein [Hamadaea flava]MCP2326265.1 FtsH-binding integral membrane protein [Hamadaea flava]